MEKSRVTHVVESFFRDIAPSRLESVAVLRESVADGVFHYVSRGTLVFGSHGKLHVTRDKVVFQGSIAEGEIGAESSLLIAPAAIPETLLRALLTVGAGTSVKPDAIPLLASSCVGVLPPLPQSSAGRRTRVAVAFESTREQLFKAFRATAYLADNTDGGKVKLRVEGTWAAGFDPVWPRNAVGESLDETDAEALPIEDQQGP
jgi:hypothetical protein